MIIYHPLMIVIDYMLIVSVCVCVCMFSASSLWTSAISGSLLSVFQYHHFISSPDRAFRGDELYSCFTDKHKLPLIFECSAEVAIVL